MRSISWLAVVLPTTLFVACGGAVSLGSIGGDAGGTDGSSGGPDGGVLCAVTECGPALGMPATTCNDGSVGGNTGRCLLRPDRTCAWEVRECPPPVCFDDAGLLLSGFKTCTTTTDCVVVSYPKDCCGTLRLAGVNALREATVKECAAARAASLPTCECPTMSPVADDDSTNAGGSARVTCNPAGQCASTFLPSCGTKTCSASQTCCEGIPLPEPTCVDGTICPVSLRKYKRDIRYLSEEDELRLRDELLRFRLATYRYKSEGPTERDHLGFLIDDVAGSAAVAADGEHVDMYGYTTMAVAALQAQERELVQLRRELDELRRGLADLKEQARDPTTARRR